eukprot:scaffold26229_cov140-Isochrysis_galbana.AAC.2
MRTAAPQHERAARRARRTSLHSLPWLVARAHSHRVTRSVVCLVLLAPPASPPVVRWRADHSCVRRRQHTRDPRHVDWHLAGPDLDVDGPRPRRARRPPHGFWKGGVAFVRVLGMAHIRALVFQPALALLVHVDVKGKAALLGAVDPDVAPGIPPTPQLWARGPPGRPLGALPAAR